MNFYNKNSRLLEKISKFSLNIKNMLDTDLLNKINVFYSVAQTIPNELNSLKDQLNNLYKELKKDYKNVELGFELEYLYQLLDYVTNNNTGYSSARKNISMIHNNFLMPDEDDEEEDNELTHVENLLNKISIELKKTAIAANVNWQADSKEVLQEIQQLKKNFITYQSKEEQNPSYEDKDNVADMESSLIRVSALIAEVGEEVLASNIDLLNFVFKYAMSKKAGFATAISMANITKENIKSSAKLKTLESNDLTFINSTIQQYINELITEANDNRVSYTKDSDDVANDMRNQVLAFQRGEIRSDIDSDEEIIDDRGGSETEEDRSPRTSDDYLGEEESDNELGYGTGFQTSNNQTSNSGYSYGSTYTPKDWVKFYKDEKTVYEDIDASNPKSQATIQKLLDVLDKLIESVEDQNKALEVIEFTKNPLKPRQKTIENPEMAKYYKNILTKITNLKKDRSSLRREILKHESAMRNPGYQQIMNKTTSPGLKMILKWRIEYNNLLISDLVNKKEELKLRYKLLKNFNGFDLTPEMLTDDKEANLKIPFSGNESEIAHINLKLREIEEASKKKITLKEKNKLEAIEVANTKKTIGPVVDEDGNVKRKNKYDWDGMDIPGFSKHLSLDLLATRKSIKDNIKKYLKLALEANKNTIYMQDLENIAKISNTIKDINNKLLTKTNDVDLLALKKVEKVKLLEAVKVLNDKLKKDALEQTEFIKYTRSVRASKFFYLFRDKFDKLKDFDLLNLKEEEVNYIKSLIDEGQKIIDFYKTNFFKDLQGNKVKTHYKTTTTILEKIITYLSKIIGDSNDTQKTQSI